VEFSSNRGHLLAKTGGEPFLLNRAHADILKLVCRWCIRGTASYSRCGLAQTKKRLEDTATGLFCNISLNQMPGRMVSALPHVDLHTTACHLKLKPKDFQITSKHWARNPSYIWHYSTSLCETHGSSFFQMAQSKVETKNSSSNWSVRKMRPKATQLWAMAVMGTW